MIILEGGKDNGHLKQLYKTETYPEQQKVFFVGFKGPPKGIFWPFCSPSIVENPCFLSDKATFRLLSVL